MLILDDDRLSAIAMGRYLEFRGYQVAVASNVDEALAAAEKLIPEILICDWKLGEERDGIDAARLLDERYQPAIVFMTGHELDALRSKLDGLVPTSCFRKPVVMNELVQVIDHARSARSVR